MNRFLPDYRHRRFPMRKNFYHLLLPLHLMIASFVPFTADAGKTHYNNFFNAEHEVSGLVRDREGKPLEGVTVFLKGTTNGAVTDKDGKFSFSVTTANQSIVLSLVGYKTKEVIAGSNLILVLEPDVLGLADVVVVGYTSQKKVNLTGSVASVGAKTLRASPIPNSANLLQGRLPGLEVIQPSGKPGGDDPMLRIRGFGSFGASSAPLVLIDGVIGAINSVAPNDIESVTVLKDAASASIYGARAANGVILISTKRAKTGAASLEYNFDFGIQNATAVKDLIWNSGEYMEMYNSARLRSGLTTFYTQAQIDDYKNATDKTLFPDYNWPEGIFQTAKIVNHSLSFSKASESSRFRMGINYTDQDGITPVWNSKRYTVNLNYDNQVLKNVRVGTIINFFHRQNTEPQGNGDLDQVRAIYARSPLAMPNLPDGRKSSGRAYSTEPFSVYAPIAFTNGDIKSSTYAVRAQAFVIVDILKNLQWETKGAYNMDYFFRKNHTFGTPGEFYFYQPVNGQYAVDQSVGNPVSLGVTDFTYFSTTPTIYSTLKYNKAFGKHDINVMGGYEYQFNNYRELTGKRVNFPTQELAELNAGSPVGQTLGGTANEWALQSYFARVAYNFEGKYLLEGNIRYDGTSRVQEDHRWGTFPSISGAWRMSEERFIKDNVSWLDNLKLRASYGLLGNQEIGLYPYQDIFGYANYSYGSAVSQGVRLSRMTDKNLQWEKTKVLDFGIDLDAWNGLFGLSFDWFSKNTYDILTTLPVPASLGLTGPITNDGSLKNTGIELELRHRNTIGEFHYDANFQIAGFQNKLESIVTPTKGVREVGLPYNSFYIYEWTGIFQSQEEINKSPKQIYNNPKPGDLKIKDQNGDGQVDVNDRVSYSPFPKFNYSFNLNVGYKRFYLSAFLQGVSGSHVMLSDWSSFPFREGIPPKAEFRDAWTPENPSNTIPAVHEFSYSGVYGYTSTYLLKNSSYLRLKNVNLSYAIPETLLSKIKIKRMSVYVSGNNLITFTDFNDGDPEVREGSTVTQFPQVRIFNAGVNVNF
ncbi:SusC/RagA family TonB-linked outer membrane protein [Flavihumibacter fluvii]|uniref:SusC/RagA family TonB-linked outer membrane protein n=1 Tax=Flavihumibacter fluvii TaxID=2838157 RepID=UPI001BDF0FED|nr:TonB-dependent receptor [Flavihumibacter fluvii]ULQ51960.1 TonB-dependent receptor [Flavihumibacter fluvii]